MRTSNFVSLQMAKRPDDRAIPDLVYMQNTRMHTITLLKGLEKPWASPRVFGNSYLYEDAHYFANEPTRHYTNDVIPWSLVHSYR